MTPIDLEGLRALLEKATPPICRKAKYSAADLADAGSWLMRYGHALLALAERAQEDQARALLLRAEFEGAQQQLEGCRRAYAEQADEIARLRVALETAAMRFDGVQIANARNGMLDSAKVAADWASDARAALRSAAQPAAERWQLIETAPKDGTPVLVSKDQMVTVGWWAAEFEANWDADAGDLVYRGAWTDGTVASWGYEENRELHPTHWMPLPAPPAAAPERAPHGEDGGAEP